MPPKKKKIKVEHTGVPWLPFSWRAVGRMILASAALAILALAVIGLDSARHQLRAAVLRQQPAELLTTPSPSWVTRDVIADFRSRMVRENKVLPNSAAELVKELEAISWVRSASVRRGPTGFTATIEYRQPVLGVDHAGKCCYVDKQGIALDATTLTAKGGASCLTLEGASATRMPRIGEPVADPSVRQAAALAGEVAALRAALELDRINVQSEAGISRFGLWTRSGGRIDWGTYGTNDGKKLAQLVERARRGAKLRSGETLLLEPETPTAISASPAAGDPSVLVPAH